MNQKSKLRSSFKGAVAEVPDSSTIAFGGFAMHGCPFNLIKALMEQSAKRLPLVANTTGGAQQPIAPGLTVDEIRAATGGTLTVAERLKQIAV
jgi:acyl CoA:acetate/3-ketoacid CoA transferase alpha subunit